MIKRYSQFIENHILESRTQGNSNLENLRDYLFAAVIKILLPLGFFVAFYNIFEAFRNGLILIGIVDTLAYAIVVAVTFIRQFSVYQKKVVVFVVIEIIAIILLAMIPQKGPGLIWMCGTIVFATGIVGFKFGHVTFAINTLILLGIGFFKTFTGQGFFKIPIEQIGVWYIIISNFVIVNAMSIFIIDRLVRGLDNNVKELKSANIQVKQNQEQLKVMYSSINEAVIITDYKDNIVIMNYKASELTGYTVEEAQGKYVDDVYDIIRESNQFIIGNRTFIKGKLRSKSGNQFDIEEYSSFINETTDMRVQKVFVFRDVTAYNRIENEMRHMQKMQAVGQLASGVAHDFNNMLGGILGYAELIEMKSSENPELLRYSKMIIETTNRAADLTSQLLAFSRQDKRAEKLINLHYALTSGIQLLQRTIDPKVKIVSDFYEMNITLHGDMTQIQNMILNLGINAKDAMPEGGQISIKTTALFIEEENEILQQHQLLAGHYVRIDVQDTGIGMEKQVMNRIFEPFFTTKPIGKGTGLGLSAVYGAVEAHGGFIEVDSTVGVGTTFSIYLPCLKPKKFVTL